jgi:hypothetical protein
VVATAPNYNKQQCIAKWRECAKIGTYSIGTIVHYANMAEPGWRAVYKAKVYAEAYSFRMRPDIYVAYGLRVS